MADYIISDVSPKNGKMRNIHEEVLGRKCYIVDIENGHRGLIKYLPDYDDHYHRLNTSTVLDVTTTTDGNMVIETENTFYHLVKT